MYISGMGLNFCHYDSLQPKISAGMITSTSVSYLKVSFWWLFYIWLDWLWDATEWGLRSWSTWPQFSRFAMKALWRWAIHFCRYPSLESCANPPFVRWGLSTPEQYATSKKQKIREINVGSYLTYVIWRVFNQKHFTRQNQLKFMFSDFCQVGAFDSRTIRDI